MSFLTNKEKKISKDFIKKGYIISKVENKKSLNYLSSFVKDKLKQFNKNNVSDLNNIHKKIKVDELNSLRLFILDKINKNNLFKYHYFNIAKNNLYCLAGNELMMQKNINFSIQLPNDNSSLLPIHSDVWSGDSPYEIVLWVPLVNCFKTKSMYILKQSDYKNFINLIKNKKIDSSEKIFNLIKKKLSWLKVDYGSYLIFNQCLPHGNVVNLENETRWSMNCRFKSLFSPYSDKKIGEFFQPITERATTLIGNKYEHPFKK